MSTPERAPEDDMTSAEKRHDQLTAAPDATEADAAPRIEVSEHDGNTRIDIAPDAPVRPGPGPGVVLDSETDDAETDDAETDDAETD